MSKTPKELAEAAAAAALDSLRAALAAESEQRQKVIDLRRRGPEWSLTAKSEEKELNEMIKRSDSAFKAWREASDSVPR